ncbi:MAG: penicillin-binding protein 2 [Candidatus Babeliales bacterium]
MNQAYKLRAGFIFLFFCSLYLIILCNLYAIQIRQRSFYINLAKQQYNVSITSAPERALIYDRNGQPLALNKMSLSAFILPKKIEHIEQLEPFLKKHFPKALQRLYKNKDAHFLYIKRKLTPEQLALIEQQNITDIKILKEPNRFYPVESSGPIVGITDVDNKGLFGIELLCNNQLGGQPSIHTLEKDARSGHFYFTKTTTTNGIQGNSVSLTIDANLQFLAFEHLKETVEKYQAQEGAVLIMNPQTGEILSMVQWPTFDANNTESLDIAYTKNKLVSDTHELGSVMKVFVALAALEEGVVTINELINCQNAKSTFLNGIKVNTWRAHSVIPFSEVIQASNNIGIAKVAQRLDKKLYDHYTKLGFGSKTKLVWPGEQKGFVNPPRNWSKQSIISLSFGYEITASLLQLAQAFCVIANDGYPVKPHIFLNEPSNRNQENPLYQEKTIELIRDILEKTVLQGTARRAALKGYKVMGKTGTANLIINGQYNHDHNTYTFAGIIEKGDYKRVIVTFIKDAAQKNLYASMVAAPLFEQIAEMTLIHDKIL